MAQFKDRLQDRALAGSRLITINPLIYNIKTFEVEYIPEMIAGATRLPLGSLGSGAHGRRERQPRTPFQDGAGCADFSGERQPYFNYLLEHQITKKTKETAAEPGLLGQLAPW